MITSLLLFCIKLKQKDKHQQVDVCVSLCVTNPNDGIMNMEKCQDKYVKLEIWLHKVVDF